MGEMKVPRFLTSLLPTIKRAQLCPECGQEFACEIGLKGCWCGQVKLSEGTLKVLRVRYKSCLCRRCLEWAEREYQRHIEMQLESDS